MKFSKYLKVPLLLIVLTAASMSGFSKEDMISSQWVTAPINIDGSPSEWTDVVPYTDGKTSVECVFRNSGENLFVLVMFKDPKYQSSIRYSGLTLWFNNAGKKKKDYGITFHKKTVTPEFYISYLEEQGRVLSEEEKQKINSMRAIIYYENKINNKQKRKDSDQAADDQPPRPAVFRSGNRNRVLIYEFSIPLERPAGEAAGVGCAPGNTVKIGLEWGGMTDELRKQALQRQVGAGGGGDIAGSRSYSIRTADRNPKRYSFWLDVKLAQEIKE